MREKEKNALAPQSYGFMHLADTDLARIMVEEFSGLDVTFDRIRIPSSGSTMFEVPGEDGELDPVKEFSGVILYHHPLFAYYKSKYKGGNNPPDCGSFDGVSGQGDPGGICKQCRLNQYGTGENDSKACKNRRRLFILREGEIFPVLLSLPAASLKVFTKYLKWLVTQGSRANKVVTRFSLRKATNKGNLVFSQAQFSLDRKLTPEEQDVISKMSGQIQAYSLQIALDYDPVADAVEDEAIIDPETGEIIEPLV